MSNTFDRIISIDWSGAGSENDRVDLRVAVWDRSTDSCRIQLPTPGATRSWRRSECRKFLQTALSRPERTLVAMDFGFSLPWGSDEAVFGVKGWRSLIHEIGKAYGQAETARAAAHGINASPQFDDHGPFRFNESRNDCRFYLDHQIAYYRLTELAAPQAISQWYLGSGGTVGFHTVTGLSAIDYLVAQRESGQLNFSVWPFESVEPGKHVLVESYPAICPKCTEDIQCQGGDEQDAWKVLQSLVEANKADTIADWFHIETLRFGRIPDVSFDDQIRFEGFIFGLR